jgi:hypothetical protein
LFGLGVWAELEDADSNVAHITSRSDGIGRSQPGVANTAERRVRGMIIRGMIE